MSNLQSLNRDLRGNYCAGYGKCYIYSNVCEQIPDHRGRIYPKWLKAFCQSRIYQTGYFRAYSLKFLHRYESTVERYFSPCLLDARPAQLCRTTIPDYTRDKKGERRLAQLRWSSFLAIVCSPLEKTLLCLWCHLSTLTIWRYSQSISQPWPWPRIVSSFQIAAKDS